MPAWITNIWIWVNNHLALIIGVAGFALTIYEIRRTKKSVDAAKVATQKTLDAMSDRSTISDIVLVQSSLREIQVALRGERYESAIIRIQNVLTILHELRKRRGFSTNERLTKIQEMVFSLKKLGDRLEKKLANPELSLSVPNANGLLSEMIYELSEWNEEMRFIQRSDENDTR